MADSDSLPGSSLGEFGRIPKEGFASEQVLATMDEFRGRDADWKAARVWALVYHRSEEHEELLKAAYAKYFSENFLNPMAFQSLKRLEHEIVRMTANMLHGGPKAVGTVTSGGTESILMAVKAARERARRRKPWILRPELVAPMSAHIAFSKACHYFGIKMVRSPVGPDFRADVKAMKKLVNRNTILVVGSAAQYPQGVIDPIEEIGQLALRKKIPFHVDGCIGGFMLPWLEKLGYPVPAWDFRVPGVTSISADLHKYGYSAKGASTVTYRDMSYLKHQFYVGADWSGGIYASPTMPGTRPGGAIAAAWAALKGIGEDGYMRTADVAMKSTYRLIEGVNAVEGLQVLGRPDMPILSFASNEEGVDIFAVADQLDQRNWHFDRQQAPPSIHLTVTAHHESVIDEFLRDLADSVAYVRAHPETSNEGNAAMYGMMAKIPVNGMIEMGVRKIMEGMWGPDGQVPDLGKLGDGDDADPMFRLMNEYGPMVINALKRAEETAGRVKAAIGLGKKPQSVPERRVNGASNGASSSYAR